MKEQYTARRQQASDKFDELLGQKQQKEQEIVAIDTEMNRLEGEYRLLTELLEPTDEATTIDINKAKDKK